MCQTCSSLEHSGHALEHIEDGAKRQKNEIKTLIKTQRRNLQAKKGIGSSCSVIVRVSVVLKRTVGDSD